jgi:hypothetical protein
MSSTTWCKLRWHSGSSDFTIDPNCLVDFRHGRFLALGRAVSPYTLVKFLEDYSGHIVCLPASLALDYYSPRASAQDLCRHIVLSICRCNRAALLKCLWFVVWLVLVLLMICQSNRLWSMRTDILSCRYTIRVNISLRKLDSELDSTRSTIDMKINRSQL